MAFARMKTIGAAVAVTLAFAGMAAGGIAACSKERPNGVFTIVIDGSSTVYPISEAAGEAFLGETRGRVRVTVAESGTGGGFRKFCRGETQIQNASRPITAGEIETCRAAGVRFVEVPIAFDALSVIVHPDNLVASLTTEQLKTMWEPGAQGKVNNWRDVDASFPDMKLELYGPGTASGTFEYFTQAINGKTKASRTDYTPSEDDNILVQGVAGDVGGLAYLGIAYYLENASRVKALPISHEGGPPVAPTFETVADGSYHPLARPIFLYVNLASLEKAPVRAFLEYYLLNADAIVRSAKYVPLPPRAYEVGLKRVRDKQPGTGFGGHSDVAASIDEVLDRPLTETVPPDAKE